LSRLLERVQATLASAEEPLTVRQVAAAVGCDQAEAEEVIWGSPDRFSWQPGGRWTTAAPKRTVPAVSVEAEHDDTRAALLDPPDAIELRAVTLADGRVLRVLRRPLDSAALFAVDQAGRDLRLVLNSSHEVFADLPLPFDEESSEGDHKRLVELLLAAWAMQEGEAPAGEPKRALEDTRLLWGRASSKLLDAER
jgi:hypothetical protein